MIEPELPTVIGWLISPTKDFILFFIKEPKSHKSFPDVMTQLWCCTIEGIPTRLKNTRKIDFYVFITFDFLLRLAIPLLILSLILYL